MSRATLRRQRLVLGLFLSLFATGQVAAWEEDVHYMLTFFLAAEAGFSRPDADQIAKGNQSLDDSAHAGAISSVVLIALTGDEGAATSVRDKHFASDAPLPSPPERRAVAPNSPSARRLVEAQLADLRPSAYLSLLGEALHPFQDSWSHQGVPDVPFGLRPNLSFAHPASRGGWRKHDADYTHLYVSDLLAAAEETYKIFQAYLTKRPELRRHPARPWAALLPIVREFAEADTKSTKNAWHSRYMPEPSGTTGVGRGGGGGPIAWTQSAPEISVLTPVNAARPVGTPMDAALQELTTSAQLFLDAWLVEQNLSNAATFIDWDGIAQQLGDTTPMGRSAIEDWGFRFMTAQLVLDHERVNQRGHVDPTHPRYLELPTTPQSEGQFRTGPRRRVRVSPNQFVGASSVSEDAVALIFDSGASTHDAIGLIWRQSAGRWRIVRMIVAAG